jgi:hypothetical protein
MRIAAVGCTLLLALGVRSAEAQSDRSPSTEAIRLALREVQPRSLILPTFIPEPEAARRLGILTLADPDPTKGEIVRVVIPIGELTTRLTRKIASAQRQRRERKAREAVERDLRDFLAKVEPRTPSR